MTDQIMGILSFKYLETLAACLGLGPPSSGHWGPRPLIYWAALEMGGGGGGRTGHSS